MCLRMSLFQVTGLDDQLNVKRRDRAAGALAQVGVLAYATTSTPLAGRYIHVVTTEIVRENRH
jgi:hypothetical protein